MLTRTQSLLILKAAQFPNLKEYANPFLIFGFRGLWNAEIPGDFTSTFPQGVGIYYMTGINSSTKSLFFEYSFQLEIEKFSRKVYMYSWYKKIIHLQI